MASRKSARGEIVRPGPGARRASRADAHRRGTPEKAGDELLRSREQLQTLSRRLITAQETERQRLARELHDDIGGALTAIKMSLQSIRRSLPSPSIVARVQEAIDVVDQTFDRVRDLSFGLRPSLLDDLGLVPALRWYVDRQASRGGFSCSLEADETIEASQEVQTACFRIAQETLTNVMRHAGPSSVVVRLRRVGDWLELTVTDDGRGFDVQTAVARIGTDASLGLLGMRERARLLGGRVTIDSRLRGGTTVRARIPLDASLPR